MARGDIFEIDAESIAKANHRLADVTERASLSAVREATASLRGRLRSAMESAAGGKAGKAFSSRVYPNADTSSPAGIVYPRGGARTRGMVEFFTQPGSVRGRRGQFLAIPTPAAGSTGRRRDLTPGEWERRTGQKLQFIYRRGRPSLLVAKGTTNNRSAAYRPITRARSKADERRGYFRGEQTVIIFVLIPSVPHANRFSMTPLINASEKEIWDSFITKVRQSGLA